MRSAFVSAALAALLLSGESLLAQVQGPAIGAVVTAVADSGPAHKAGIARGDIILAVDGKDVGTPRDIVEAIGGRKEGDQVSVEDFPRRRDQDRAGDPRSSRRPRLHGDRGLRR